MSELDELRRRRLMRMADTAARHKFSLSGREKEAQQIRKPSLPKMPWDDKQEDGDGG